MRSDTARGVLIALAAALTFGGSGPFVKPLLEAGWSPAAAVTVRALVGGVVILPFALSAMRGRLAPLWRARRRVLAMALIGVAGTQLAYFASLNHLDVGTAILIEYLAPVLLVGWVWLRTRRVPKPVVIIGAATAVAGLVLVVGPGAAQRPDLLGLLFASLALIGCAVYYVIAAAPSDGLPPVALAAAGLLGGGIALGIVGATGLVPFTADFGSVALFGGAVPWWVPMLIVGVLSTGVAYTLNIAAAELLGSRLSSFMGLLEVVFATVYAWLLLGEQLTPLQGVGGLLILAGIAAVHSDRSADAVPEALEIQQTPVATR